MPSLSVVLPAHNEEANVAGVVAEVFDVVQEWGIDAEVILVNDGSTDGTGAIARTLAQRFRNFRLVEHFPSRHYGGALKAGFAAATKEVVVFCAADRQFVFREVHRLWDRFTETQADIVSGYRADRHDAPIRKLNAFGWSMATRALFGYLCRDINCGFKLIRREVLEQVEVVADGAVIDLELLAGAKARGYRIAEVEVSHLPRTAGAATGARFSVILRAFGELFSLRRRLSKNIRAQGKARTAAETTQKARQR